MFLDVRKSKERRASKKFYKKCPENSRSQIVFRTDIFATPPLVSPRNDVWRRTSILMTCHNPDLGSASNWMKQTLTNQKHYPDLGRDALWVWIAPLVSPTSLRGETSAGVPQCQLFSQANWQRASSIFGCFNHTANVFLSKRYLARWLKTPFLLTHSFIYL